MLHTRRSFFLAALAPPIMLLGSLLISERVGASNGSERGGGSVVVAKSGGDPVFLDLYLYDKNFRESREGQAVLLPTAFQRRTGYDRIYPRKLKIFDSQVRATLDRARRSAPSLVQALQRLIEGGAEDGEGFGLTYVDRINVNLAKDQRRVHLSNELMAKVSHGEVRVETFIQYNVTFGAIVGSLTWNTLGPLSQTAALIHEAFRELQLRYGFDFLSDELIQSLVGEMVLGSPQEFSPFLTVAETLYREGRTRTLEVSAVMTELRRGVSAWLCEYEYFVGPRIPLEKTPALRRLVGEVCDSRSLRRELTLAEIAFLNDEISKLLNAAEPWAAPVYARGKLRRDPEKLRRDVDTVRGILAQSLETNAMIQTMLKSADRWVLTQLDLQKQMETLRSSSRMRMGLTEETILRRYLDEGNIPPGSTEKRLKALGEELEEFFKRSLKHSDRIHYLRMV